MQAFSSQSSVKENNIPTWRDGYESLDAAPNPLMDEKRKNALKDTEIAALRAELKRRDEAAVNDGIKFRYMKDMEDTITQIGEIVGVHQDADKLILVVGEIAEKAKQIDDSVVLDAKRWRAFLSSARIRIHGTAGILEPKKNLYAHFGMEIWTVYDDPNSLEIKDENAVAVERITKYADIAIQAQALRND